MNIYNTLNLINGHISNAYNSLTNKGVNIQDNKNCQNLTKNINNIPNNFLQYNTMREMEESSNHQQNDYGLIYNFQNQILNELPYQYINQDWNIIPSSLRATKEIVWNNQLFIGQNGQIEYGIFGKPDLQSKEEWNTRKEYFSLFNTLHTDSENLSYLFKNYSGILPLPVIYANSCINFEGMYSNSENIFDFYLYMGTETNINRNFNNIFYNAPLISIESLNYFFYNLPVSYKNAIKATSNNLNYFGISDIENTLSSLDTDTLNHLNNLGWNVNYIYYNLKYSTIENPTDFHSVVLRGHDYPPSLKDYNNADAGIFGPDYLNLSNGYNSIYSLEINYISPKKQSASSARWGEDIFTNLVYVNYWNMSNIYDMSYFFHNSPNLISFSNMIEGFSSHSNYELDSLFINCQNLQTVKDIQILNHGINAYRMFKDCENLENFENINMPLLKEATDMFEGCNNLSVNSYATIASMLPLAANLTQQTLSHIGLDNHKFTNEQLTILNTKGYIDAIPKYPSDVYNIYYTLREEGN